MAGPTGNRVSGLRKGFLTDDEHRGDWWCTSEQDFKVEGEAIDRNNNLLNHLLEDSGEALISSTPKTFTAIHKDDFTEDFCLSEEEIAQLAKCVITIEDHYSHKNYNRAK